MMCKQMKSDPVKQGFYYKELSDVARVIELIIEGLSNGKVSVSVFVILILFAV